MAFTSYDTSGLDVLGRSLGQLGQSVGDAYQSYQQRQRLADLGTSIQSGDLQGAAQKAIAGGDLATGLKLYQMWQGSQPDPTLNSALGLPGASSAAPASASAGSTPDPSSFVKQYAPQFLDASNATGVDPRIIAAQHYLESAGGTKMVGNNLAGIKSTDGSGVSAPTTEYVNGQPINTTGNFASFATPQDSIKGYADFINNNPRYAALKSAKTFDDQVNALGASGYATDPNYAASVRSIAQKIDPSLFQANTAATGQAPGNQVAASGNFLPRSLGPAPGAATNDDPPVSIPGYPGTWTRASAGATEADNSPEVSVVAQAQGKALGQPPAATAGSGNDAQISALRQQKAQVLGLIGKYENAQNKGAADQLKLRYQDLDNQIKQLTQSEIIPLTTPEQRAKYGIDPKSGPVFLKDGVPTPLGKQTINVNTQGENAEAAASGKNAADRRDAMLTTAEGASERIGRLQLLNNVLQQTKTGPLAGPLGTVGALASAVGMSTDAIKAIGLDPNQPVNNETANKLAGELVVGSIGAKNGGFPASNFSIAERQFIERMFPNIAAQSGSNQFVSDVLVAKDQRNLDKAQEWFQYKQQQKAAKQTPSYEDFEDQWLQKHAKDNIFAPIIQKYNAGGYTPEVPPGTGGQGGGGAGTQTGQAAPKPVSAMISPQDYAKLPVGATYPMSDGSTRRKAQ